MRSFFSVFLALFIVFALVDTPEARADLIIDDPPKAEPDASPDASADAIPDMGAAQKDMGAAVASSDDTEDAKKETSSNKKGCAQAGEAGVPLVSLLGGVFLLGLVRRRDDEDA